MKLFQFCLFMVVALVYSCGLDSHLPREGTINYQINYLSDRKSNPIISYLPETMKVYFKDNKTVTEIQGYMGFFSLKYYTNAKRHVNCSYLRILDKQYIYLAPTDELAYGFDNMDSVQIRYLNETKQIAGYICNKAIATNSELGYMPLVLYYTYEIDVNKPNYNTPFSEIEGVLLQSQYRIAGVDMQFVATNVSSAPVKNEVFEIPPNCQQVSLTEMQDLVNKFNK